uniref:Uncharacterized protein n=1 Tax=Solanum lycopersicum TaxID=4081 RepID=A0A494G9R1_SOLLC
MERRGGRRWVVEEVWVVVDDERKRKKTGGKVVGRERNRDGEMGRREGRLSSGLSWLVSFRRGDWSSGLARGQGRGRGRGGEEARARPAGSEANASDAYEGSTSSEQRDCARSGEPRQGPTSKANQRIGKKGYARFVRSGARQDKGEGRLGQKAARAASSATQAAAATVSTHETSTRESVQPREPAVPVVAMDALCSCCRAALSHRRWGRVLV